VSQHIHGYIGRVGLHKGMGLMVVIILGLGVVGWFLSVKLVKIEVTGNENAATNEIMALIDVSPGETLFDIDTGALSQQVNEHPWVLETTVSRFPNGTLKLTIVERTPVALVLSEAGRSVFYLDRAGVRLLAHIRRAYDVPILRGYGDGYAVPGETTNEVLRRFLLAIADDRAETGNMISEISVDSDQIGLRLEPAGNHGAIPVKLGSSEFEMKLHRLHAFWDQTLLPRQDKKFKWIDLRYDSQIVVQESAP
jgi:cell division protein FtsQ